MAELLLRKMLPLRSRGRCKLETRFKAFTRIWAEDMLVPMITLAIARERFAWCCANRD